MNQIRTGTDCPWSLPIVQKPQSHNYVFPREKLENTVLWQAQEEEVVVLVESQPISATPRKCNPITNTCFFL